MRPGPDQALCWPVGLMLEVRFSSVIEEVFHGIHGARDAIIGDVSVSSRSDMAGGELIDVHRKIKWFTNQSGSECLAHVLNRTKRHDPCSRINDRACDRHQMVLRWSKTLAVAWPSNIYSRERAVRLAT
jgi:hypothetical protein